MTISLSTQCRRNKTKCLVYSEHVAVFPEWQHQTAAVTSDIITGANWPFFGGSVPRCALVNNLGRWYCETQVQQRLPVSI